MTGPGSERIHAADRVVAAALAGDGYVPDDDDYRKAVDIVSALRDEGLLPGPDTITVPREDVANLVLHVKHDVLCTPPGPETYMGLDCCRAGPCAEAEVADEVHGSWVGSLRRHPAITDAVLAALSEPPASPYLSQHPNNDT